MDTPILQLIDDYLTGNLNDRDRITFEERLKHDHVFRKEFEFQKNIEVVLADKQKNKLFDTIQNVEKQYFKKEEPARVELQHYLPYAAMVVCILGLLVIALYITNKPTPNQLFSEYYKPYETYTTTRSTKNQTVNTFEDGLRWYDLKQFDKAITVFNQLETKDPVPAVSFYSAICNLELNNHQKAIQQLTQVANQKNNFNMQANWFLAMAYLKNNEPTKAKPLLEALTLRPGRYKTQASKILRKL